jgi:phosphate/sulfate permease
VGAIAGFGVVQHAASLQWWPNMGLIFISWISSPIVAGLFSGTIYYVTRWLVLRQRKELALKRQRLIVSVLMGFTLGLTTLFVGLNFTTRSRMSNTVVPVLSLVVWFVVTLVCYFIFMPLVFRKASKATFGQEGEALVLEDMSTGLHSPPPSDDEDDTAELVAGTVAVQSEVVICCTE